MIKRILYILLLCVSASYGADIILGNYDEITWANKGAGVYVASFGGTTSWIDPYDPAIVYYLQDLQPSNYIADMSGNGYRMQAESTYVAAWWDYPNGYWLDDSASYIVGTNAPQHIQATDALSWSGWIKMDEPANSDGIFNIGTLASAQPEFGLYTAANKLVARVNGSTTEGNGQLTGPTSTTTNWSLMTLTYDKNHIRIYTNGYLAASNAYTASLDCSGLKYGIGTHYNTTSVLLQGNVQHIRLYERTLSDAEVLTLWTTGRTNMVVDTISTANLISYLPMTNQYTTVCDASGNHMYLDSRPSFANAPTFRQTESTNSQGRIQYSVYFDGTDDALFNGWNAYASQQYRMALVNPGTNEFTLTARVRFEELTQQGIVGRGFYNALQDGLGLYMDNNRYVYAQISDSAGTTIDCRSDSAMSTNTWCQFAMVREKIGQSTNSVTFYIDAVAQAFTTNESINCDIALDQSWAVGSRSGGGLPIQGWLMGARYYTNTALSATEVTNLYQNTLWSNDIEERRTGK